MPHIRPVSDGDTVVMSIEQYENLQQDNMIFPN